MEMQAGGEQVTIHAAQDMRSTNPLIISQSAWQRRFGEGCGQGESRPGGGDVIYEISIARILSREDLAALSETKGADDLDWSRRGRLDCAGAVAP